jgi:drug/metabolite transporter (DMT)-like permease
LTIRKYLVILCMVLASSTGNALLARGMKELGSIDVHHISRLLFAFANPFILLGMFSLLVFLSSQMTALSFADLTYVLPATAIGYVLVVLFSIVWLHEYVSPRRWTGVAFIVIGVGIVAGGPARTEHPPAPVPGSGAASA